MKIFKIKNALLQLLLINIQLNNFRKLPLKMDYVMKIEPRPIRVELTGNPILPESSLILPGRDDAAEYDDNNENQNFNDDKK